MTDELWEAFGFEKSFCWNVYGWTHKGDTNIKFYEGIAISGLGNREPNTVEELTSLLQKYWENKYKEEGKREIQSQLQTLLGLDN